MDSRQQKVAKLVDALDRACRSLGFMDYMPAPMIGHFVRQVVPASFKDDNLDLDQFYKWVRQEYSVPDHVFSRIFERMKEEAEELDVALSLPIDYEPGFNETVRQWLKSELKDVVYSELKEEMRDEVKEDLQKELRPEVHQRLRADFEKAGIDTRDMDDSILASMSDAPSDADCTSEEDREAAIHHLRKELWPAVYEEVRAEVERELRPQVAEQLKASIREEVEQDLRKKLQVKLREEMYPRLHETVSNEIRSSNRERVLKELREELSPRIIDELRVEMGETAGTSDTTEPESVAVDSAGPPELPPTIALGADTHLGIIRNVRQRLIPEIRKQIVEDLAGIARRRQEEEERQRLRECLSDSDYCLERIREFLFPEQPSAWSKVRKFIDPTEWSVIVLAQENAGEVIDSEELSRSRKVIREALSIKAEINDEIGAGQNSRGPSGVTAMLEGADEVLDFALKSISELLQERGVTGPPVTPH